MLPDVDSAGLVLVVHLIRVLVPHPLITPVSEHVALKVAVLEILRKLALASNAEYDLRTPTTGEKLRKLDFLCKGSFPKHLTTARDFILAQARASRKFASKTSCQKCVNKKSMA